MRRWIEWYGSHDRSPEEVAEAVGEALGVPLDRREEYSLGSIYVSERPDGEIIKVVSNRSGLNGERRILPKHEDLLTLIVVIDSQRWNDVRAAFRMVPGLERLPQLADTRPPRRTDCYGWPGSQSAAKERLERALALSFREHEGVVLGRRWRAEGPGVEIEVRDNYLPHLRHVGEEPMPSEPRFAEYPRLVYVTGTNLDWFDRVRPTLEAIPNLVPLYGDLWGPPETTGDAR